MTVEGHGMAVEGHEMIIVLMFAGVLICFQSAYIFYKAFGAASGGNPRFAPAFMAFWNGLLGALLGAAALIRGPSASAATLIAGPVGGLFFTFAGVMMIKVLATGPYVWSVLTMNLANFIPVVFALVFLGEPISATQAAGVLVILSILFFMNAGLKSEDRPFTKKWMTLAILNMLMNGAIFCTQKAQSHFSGGGESLEFLSLMFLCGSLFAFVYYLRIRKRGEKFPFRAFLRPALGLTCGIGFGNVLSMALMGQIPAAAQFPIIVGGGIMISAALGVILYKERVGWRLYLNAGLLIAGVILLGI